MAIHVPLGLAWPSDAKARESCRRVFVVSSAVMQPENVGSDLNVGF